MEKLVKNIIVFFYLPLLLVHFICYCIYRDKLEADIKRLTKYRRWHYRSLWSFFYLLVFEKPFRNLFYHRIGRVSYLFMRLLLPQYQPYSITKITNVGTGLIGEHPFSTILNAKKIGDNFLVRNNVTVGSTEKGRPTIGNNVIVNAGSIVIGDISIGDNVIVGAGTVVTKSIPSNCVVVGNPARIIRKDGIRVDLSL